MKRILLLILVGLLDVTSFISAQDGQTENVVKIEQSLFKEKENYRNEDEAKSYLSRVMHYDFNIDDLSSSIQNRQNGLQFYIPTLDGEKHLILKPRSVLTESYQLYTDKGIAASTANGYLFYRGYVEGQPSSSVGLSILGKEVHLMIFDKDGIYQVSKVDVEENIYAGFYTADELQSHPIACETETSARPIEEEPKLDGGRSAPLECVEIYLEIDHKSYTENGSDVTSVENWALAILATVAIFYEDSGIPIKVSGMKIYTSSDPYSHLNNTSDVLTEFRNAMNSQGFDGRLAHLMSGRNIGGGRAYLNVLCSTYSNVAVSGNLSSGNTTYNTYTWNINVIAHELGHNFGANHTHDCVWDTDGDPNTPLEQIDDCGNIWLTNEGYSTGSCYDANNNILPGNQATIMSYCHVVGGASINLNYGFHPLVRERIYDRFSNTNCGGTEDCSGIAPLNNNCHNAVRMTPTTSCNIVLGDNLDATDSGLTPAISCGNPSNVKDVWYIVEVPSHGKLDIETKSVSNGLQDLIIQLYSGDCTTLTEVNCDDNSGENSHAKVSVNDISLAHQDLWIRVVEKSGLEGNFGICAYAQDLPCSSVRDSLISFYNASNGPSWTNRGGWEAGAVGQNCDYCNWEGVTCNSEDKIVQLNLRNNNLTGVMSTALQELEDLFYLDLSNNSIGGELPDIFGSFSSMTYLNLEGNSISGEMPSSVNSLTDLGYLNVKNNSFFGSLPPGLGNFWGLQYIDLSDNLFTGCYPYFYIRFCNREFFDLSGNTGLPNAGDVSLFCTDYTGSDYDQDGFCHNIDDCNDYNSNYNPDAPELCDGEDNDCDGEVDEGLDNGPNRWIGTNSGGSWEDDSSWSMGHTPKVCEDVELGMNGEVISILAQESQGMEINLRSLCIGPNSELDLGLYSSMQLKGIGHLNNQGVLHINGSLTLRKIKEDIDGIVNSGTINIASGRSVYIEKSGLNGIHNKASGIINNNGFVEINGNDQVNGQHGINNEGVINNSSYLSIYGNIKMNHIFLKSGSTLNSIGTGARIILDQSNGSEGN